jgi:hypothetical protein
MKLPLRIKYILFITLSSVYLTGLLAWVFTHWFQVNLGLGPEPSFLRLWWLQIHSIISLWFLLLFGYLFHLHVQPAFRGKRKLKSGVALTGILILLILTVPALFYLSNESAKSWVAGIHTYVGFTVVGFFAVHWLA